MGLWRTVQPVPQPGGQGAPHHRNGRCRARRGPGTRMRASPRPYCPHFAHQGKGRGRSQGRAAPHTAWSRPDSGHQGAPQSHVPEGGRGWKRAQNGGAPRLGRRERNCRQALVGLSGQFPDFRNRKWVLISLPGRSGRGCSPGSASGLGQAQDPAASVGP